MSDEKDEIQAYVIKHVVSGQVVTTLGADTAKPRDVIRRLKEQCKRYEDGQKLAQDERRTWYWHELLLEGDGEGDGVVWVPNPLQVIEVSTPIDFGPEELQDDLNDEDEDEDEEDPAPLKLPAKGKKGLLQQ